MSLARSRHALLNAADEAAPEPVSGAASPGEPAPPPGVALKRELAELEQSVRADLAAATGELRGRLDARDAAERAAAAAPSAAAPAGASTSSSSSSSAGAVVALVVLALVVLAALGAALKRRLVP